jgi:hypothetical protein
MPMENKKKNMIIQLIGWYGVAAILLAYLLLNLEMIYVDSVPYTLLNLTGALGIMIDAWVDRNYQPVVLNAVWALIAVWGIIRVLI